MPRPRESDQFLFASAESLRLCTCEKVSRLNINQSLLLYGLWSPMVVPLTVAGEAFVFIASVDHAINQRPWYVLTYR